MPVTLTFPPIGLRLTYPYSVGEMADAADSIDSIDEEALLISARTSFSILVLENGDQTLNVITGAALNQKGAGSLGVGEKSSVHLK